MYLHKTKNGHYTPPCCYFSGELEVVECLPQTFSGGMMVYGGVYERSNRNQRIYRRSDIGKEQLMDQELFNPQSSSVSSSRIIYTPSTFARTSLLHLQEVGSLQAIHEHTSTRTNLTSFLCFVVLSGTGRKAAGRTAKSIGRYPWRGLYLWDVL